MNTPSRKATLISTTFLTATERIGSTAVNDNDRTPPPAAPGARMPLPLSPEATLQLAEFRAWLLHRLPKLNSGIEDCRVDRDTLFREAGRFLDSDRIDAIMPTAEASPAHSLAVLGLLGFALSSLERHSQGAGRPPGVAVASYPGLTERLVRLGRIAGHPPRDSHYTYWLLNAMDEPITFTGEPGEVYFNQLVNQSDARLTAVADRLLKLRNGTLSLGDPEALVALEASAADLETLCVLHHGFRQPSAESKGASLTPAVFSRMRSYLLPYPVAGVTYTGPNPAYVAAYFRSDLAVGCAGDTFAATVRQRLAFMNERDVALLERDMTLPSVADVLLRRLELSATDVSDAAILAFQLAELPDAELDSVRAFARLATGVNALSCIHWDRISPNPVHNAGRMPAGKRVRTLVKPDEGESGPSLDRTRALMAMRRDHWAASVLPQAVALMS